MAGLGRQSPWAFLVELSGRSRLVLARSSRNAKRTSRKRHVLRRRVARIGKSIMEPAAQRRLSTELGHGVSVCEGLYGQTLSGTLKKVGDTERRSESQKSFYPTVCEGATYLSDLFHASKNTVVRGSSKSRGISTMTAHRKTTTGKNPVIYSTECELPPGTTEKIGRAHV